MDKLLIFGDEQQVQIIKSRIGNQTGELLVCDLKKTNLSLDVISNGTICIVSEEWQEQVLLSCGVNANKIINFFRFEKTLFNNPIEDFSKNIDYTGIIMGMSHSQCAIIAEELTDNVYCKISAPSLDMFLHFHFMKKLSEIHSDELKRIKHIIIELPYYIFNYDLSRFGMFVYNRLNYFEIVGDYHHLGETAEQKNRIEEFLRFKGLFTKELRTTEPQKSKNVLREIIKKFYKKYRVLTNKDKVWRIHYPDTIRENKEWWKRLLKLIGIYCPEAKITVLVMPFNPIFRFSHVKKIKMMRDMFYSSLEKGDFQVVDHFAYFNNDSYFDDHCHLNIKGSQKYTRVLRKILAQTRNI